MITYRRPRVDEAEVFATIHVNCWREAYEGIIPADYLAQQTPEKRKRMWGEVTVNPDRIVIGAYLDGQAVGFALAGKPVEQLYENEDGQLAALYILQKFHRMGIGRALVKQSAAQWMGMGGHSMSLATFEANTPARRFYEALGARILKFREDNWDGMTFSTVIYVWADLPALIIRN